MNKLKDFHLNSVLLGVIALLLLLCFTGCTTQKGVSRYLQEKPKEKTEPVVKAYLSVNELFAATFCETEYPIQEQTETRTDSVKVPVFIKGDSIPCPPVTDTKTGKTYTPMVKCPDVSYYQTTITTLEKTTKESTAKADRYRLERDKYKGDSESKSVIISQKDELIADLSKDLTRAYWFGGILIAAIIGVVALKVFKPF